MQTRRLNENDAGQFRSIRLRALREHPEAFGEAAAHWESLPLEQVVARLLNPASPNSFVMGAFESEDDGEGTLIGTTGFVQSQGEKTQHKGFIWGVYVVPEVRGTGAGKHLMEQTIAHLRTLPSLEQVTLAVVSTNFVARNLYLSLGFQIYGLEQRAVCVDGVYSDEELMVLFLRE